MVSKLDPDSAFYRNVNVDSDPGSQTKWIFKIFKVTKVNFYKGNILEVCNRVNKKKHTYKSILERQETRFICQFLSISMLLDLDSHSHHGSGSRTAKNQCGSGSTTLPFRGFPLTNHNRAKDVGLVGLPEGGAGVEGAAVTRVGGQGAQQQLLGLLQQQLLQRIHLS